MLHDLKASDIMLARVITIHAEESVAVARLIMERRGVGALPVLSNGKLAGMLTHRDAILLGRAAKNLKVSEVMARELVVIKKSTPLKEIAQIMKATGLQRLPVVERGRLVGLVTQSCVINALAERI